MKIRIIGFILIFKFINLTVSAQQPQLLLERSYLKKSSNTIIEGSTQDKTGNLYYSGISNPSGGKWDNYILKIKVNTDTLWTRKSPVKLDSPLLAIQALPGGGILTGGNVVSPPVGMNIRRISPNGFTLWTKSYTSIPNVVSSILSLPGKDLLFGGSYYRDFSFTRTDSLGNIIWNKSYPWSLLNDALIDMKVTKTGNIIAIGTTNHPVGPSHIKLMLLNQNGDSLLGRQLVLTDSSRTETMFYNFSSIAPLSDGGYIFTCLVDTLTSSSPVKAYLGMIVKVDANLNYQWKYIHRTSTTEEFEFTKVKELTDGTIVALGYKTRPFSSGNVNGFQLYRFTPQGQLLNTYPFTSNICTQVVGVTFDALPDSTFIIGGRCSTTLPVSFGFYVAKVKIPNLPLPLPATTISGTKEELISQIGLGQSYPNPTAAEVTIPYILPKSYRKASILIREISTGREIRKYDLKRNESSLRVNVSSLSNGLYLYSLIIDDKPIATRKLALMK